MLILREKVKQINCSTNEHLQIKYGQSVFKTTSWEQEEKNLKDS